MNGSNLIILFKNLVRPIRNLLENTNREFQSWKYLHTSPRGKSSAELTFHLLVVKKKDYAKLAKICVESFLYFHPRSKVVIHCDSKTITACKQKLKVSQRRGRVSYNLVHEDDSWQVSKLHLIQKLNGTYDYFVDADMRWNSALVKPESVSFFVEEFILNSDPNYLDFLNGLKFQCSSSTTMKNTSFFTWAGYRMTEPEAKSLFDLFQDICQRSICYGDEAIGKSMLRISEQLALSIASDFWGVEVGFLKSIDGLKDGSILESSYYGATGATF